MDHYNLKWLETNHIYFNLSVLQSFCKLNKVSLNYCSKEINWQYFLLPMLFEIWRKRKRENFGKFIFKQSSDTFPKFKMFLMRWREIIRYVTFLHCVMKCVSNEVCQHMRDVIIPWNQCYISGQSLLSVLKPCTGRGSIYWHGASFPYATSF